MARVEARVLVFDVEPVERDRLDRALSLTGAEVIGAPGGETAVPQVDLVRPDLIILDVPSQGSDRWETLVRIRELPYVPVIALRGPEDSVAAVESLILGADYSMTKPVRTRELLARVRALLRRTQGKVLATCQA
jgi:two-component system OmpR family response regulator